MNDRVALGVYQALTGRGRAVPADVSVMSFDDSDLAAWLQPPLSSVALPHRDMAQRAVRLLLTEGDLREEVIRLPMPVRRRESIGPPATGG
jgi:LacI family transcriptional regulator